MRYSYDNDMKMYLILNVCPSGSLRKLKYTKVPEVSKSIKYTYYC